jgi:hypothetical protein
MTEGHERTDPSALQRRLPDRWGISTSTQVIHGHTEAPDTEEAPRGVDSKTRFTIQPAEGDLWRASWEQQVNPSNGGTLVSDQVTGTKERCVEWVVGKATRNSKE